MAPLPARAQTQKTILITGCSSGIGYDAAHRLKSLGWRVFATCRQEADCARLREEGLESFPLDYADEASIAEAVDETLRRSNGRLDALYNNGAYGIPGAVEDLPRDALRAIFEANFFGYIDLTNRILPIMRAQGHGRIIQCSSVLGFAAMPFRGAYNATKFALEGATDTLRYELKGSGIDLILIEPGPITTQIRVKSQPHFEKWIKVAGSAHEGVYERVLKKRLYSTSTKKDWGELPPSAVTEKLIHALTSVRPKPRYYVTRPTYIAGAIIRLLPTRLRDRLLGKY